MAPRSITGCYPPVTGSVRAAAIVPPLLACGRSGASGCPAPPPISTYAYRAAPPTPPDVDHRAGSQNLQNPDPGVEVGCRDGEAGGAVAGARGAARRPPPPLLPKRVNDKKLVCSGGDEMEVGRGCEGSKNCSPERAAPGGHGHRRRRGRPKEGRHADPDPVKVDTDPAKEPANLNLSGRRRPQTGGGDVLPL